MSILGRALRPMRWVFGNRIRLIVAVILIALLGLGGYRTLGQPQTKVTYQTTQVQKGTLITTVTASGNISAGNSAGITTQASGIVANVYVKDGNSVFQGQKIADLNLDLAGQQKQAAAYSSFVSASDALLNAQNTLRGATATVEKVIDDIHLAHGTTEAAAANETLSERQTRTSAEVAKDNAFNGVKTAQAQIGAASLALAQTSAAITAPTAGTISGLTLTPGVVVSGNSSSSSTSSTTSTATSYGSVNLTNSQIQAIVNLSEIDVTMVQTGQKATLTLDAFPGKTFTGKVTAINTNGLVSSGVTTYPTTISFDTALNNIYPNMAVSASIITDVKNNVLLVPSSAVQTSGPTSSVRVLENGQPSTVDVEIGGSSDSQTEITSGLNEGDQVVTGTTGGTSTTRSGTGTSIFGGGRGFGGRPGGG